MPNRRLVLVLAAAALSACSAPPVRAHGQLVDVQLVDRESAQPLPVHHHRGSAWVAGRPGSRYAVRLSNRSAARVLVVLSIDGVNAVSGETAAPGQTGYVLAPWQTTEITGWRKSLTEAAAFYFTALPDSYAARTDRPDNVGVIGVAVFREREQPPEVAAPPRPLESESRVAQGAGDRERSAGNASPAAPAPSAKAAARDERLGTGHGEREYAPTTRVSFERATERPAELLRLRYDSVENLVAAGIVVRPARRPTVPDPFPGFAPDPHG